MATSIFITRGARNPAGTISVGVNGVISKVPVGVDTIVGDDVLEALQRKGVTYRLSSVPRVLPGMSLLDGTGGPIAFGVNGVVGTIPVDAAFTPTTAQQSAIDGATIKSSIILGGGMSITGTPAAGVIGATYAFTPTVLGNSGTKAFAFSNTAGLTANGLTFSTSTGAIMGTITGAAGTINGTITVTDSTGATAALPVSITIATVATALGTLAFSTGFTVGTDVGSGTVTGATAGSSISGITGVTFAGSGTTRTYTGTPTTAGQSPVEMLAGATGSPKTSSVVVAAAAVTMTAPFYDNFAVDGPIKTRSGWTVESTTSTAASTATTPATLNGVMKSTGSTGGIHAYHDTLAGAGESFGWFKGAPAVAIASKSFEGHVTVDPTNNNDNMTFSSSTASSGFGSSFNQGSLISGTTGTNVSGGGISSVSDAVFEMRAINDGGVMKLRGYYNGRPMIFGSMPDAGQDIAAFLGRAPNGRYGIQNSNTSVDKFGAGNRATDNWVSIMSASPIRQRGQVYKIYGEYGSPRAVTPATLGSLKIYGFNADGSALTGYNGIAVSNLVASGGTWSGTIANPNVDNFSFEVRWEFTDSNGNAAFAAYPTCNIVNGDSIVFEGQSQVGFLAGGGGVFPAPTLTSYNAQISNPTAPGRNFNFILPANTTFTGMANAFQAYSGKPVQFVTSAYGGVSYNSRGPGGASGQWPFTVEALQSFSNNAPALVVTSGGSTIDGGFPIAQSIIDYADAMDAAVGKALLYAIMPEGNQLRPANSGASAACDATRREMWRLTRDFPARFKLVGWRNDMQHHINGLTPTGDGLHYARSDSTGYIDGTTIGTPEHGVRMALGAALILGYTTEDYRGPKIISARRVDANTLAVKYALGAFTGIQVGGAGFGGFFNGGHRFNTAADFTGTALAADSNTPQAVSGGQAEIYFHFAAALPATVYLSGPYGSDPFNTPDTPAITMNMQANASVVQGTKTGHMPTAMQPSFDVGGTNIDFLQI